MAGVATMNSHSEFIVGFSFHMWSKVHDKPKAVCRGYQDSHFHESAAIFFRTSGHGHRGKAHSFLPDCSQIQFTCPQQGDFLNLEVTVRPGHP